MRRSWRRGRSPRPERTAPASSSSAEARTCTRSRIVARAVAADVADHEQVEQAAAEVEDSLGPIDVWVNNAMATVFAPFAEIAPEEYRRAAETTYLGYVWGTMAALRRMLPRDRGVIVQVGSALA